MIPVTQCFFVSDLHGSPDRYAKLFDVIRRDRPGAVFLGGDLFPSSFPARQAPAGAPGDFLEGVLVAGFQRLRAAMHARYPRVFLILGNDDPRVRERDVCAAADAGLWEYLHLRRAQLGAFTVFGYACVPPTPFLMKDWERYDVSMHVDPGCVSPEEGWRSVAVPAHEIHHGTMQKDLHALTGADDLSRAVVLFHSPPYQTHLDRAALDEKTVDYVPLDVHVGSIAIRRFIEARQPLATLHGHIHESARITGDWKERIGRTHAFSAAHDGPELALVRFDLERLEDATRELV